jgi:hypothetical protein
LLHYRPAMALPYPEGEVFFKRSVLKDNDNGLDPDNLASFNSHALVEWCWNESYRSSYSRSHALYQPGKHDEKKKYYYNNAMVISFGTKEGFETNVGSGDGDSRHDSRHSGIEREVKTLLPASEEYERRQRGGPLMTALTPIKLEPSQPYMYIDLTFPIRAVYFPLAQKPSKVFPDLCSYLMVDFRLRQGVRMWDKPKIEGKTEQMFREQMEREGIDAREKERLQQLLNSYLKSKRNVPPPYVPMNFDLHAGLGVRPNCESRSTFPSIRVSQTEFRVTYIL